MIARRTWRRWTRRLGFVGSSLLLTVIVGLAVFVPMTALTLEQTAKPEFCNSCHIMEPFYESWRASGHADVGCIECHYEPGTLETVEGKFKALSQLAKYVTRTQGTKPWAEVSDQSCLRAGCHSTQTLEGPIAFGGVKFDHRQHLLESRPGRRLRCTSCHSQIVQGDHIAVTETVCFMCHFMPDSAGLLQPGTSDCQLCHDPPGDVIDVAGAPFGHADYISRGVDCLECHAPIADGDGTVRLERCRSCHGEAEYLARYDEKDWLHEEHLINHKVECFECHDEIRHGLFPLDAPEPTGDGTCGACHVNAHDANRLVYAGTGALGVEDRPSRMYATRVICAACHTGRSGFRNGGGAEVPARGHGAGHGMALNPTIASAGEVDCIHCHGVGYDGMLGRWQTVVGGALERLGGIAADLESRLPDDPGSEARRLHDEARFDLELLRVDGSRGAHNVLYALDVLGAAAERLDRTGALTDPEFAPSAVLGLPRVSSDGCTECHLGIELEPLEVHGRPFSHDKHLGFGTDCRECHSTTEHGAPAFPRDECASCHHEEREDEAFDPWDCSSCHAQQDAFIMGTALGFEETLGGMEEKDCEACHGEPPDIVSPNPKLCALCHDESYSPLMEVWRAETTALVERLQRSLASPPPQATPEALERAREAVRAYAADGSGGAHNIELMRRILTEALDGLQ